MITAYESFKKVLDRGNQKRQELKEEIKASHEELDKLEGQYNDHVLSGNDEEADKLFNQLYELRRKIENSTRKLQIIKTDKGIRTNEVEKSAQDVVDSSFSFINKSEKEKKSLEKELEVIMESYFQKVEQIGKVCEGIREQHQYIAKVVQYLPDDKKPTGFHPKIGYHPATRAAFDLFNFHNFKIQHDPLIMQAFRGERKEGVIRP